MKKVLLKYNNSGLYKEKGRTPPACGNQNFLRRSIERKQQHKVAPVGTVEIVGSRITPIH
jgi:hypothetical protein